MAMESILERLETRIEEMVAAYDSSRSEVATLAARVAELEERLEQKNEAGSEAEERIKALEGQRDELTTRLEKVLSLIDGALAKADATPAS
jgi:chromosome segregation ATPase